MKLARTALMLGAIITLVVASATAATIYFSVEDAKKGDGDFQDIFGNLTGNIELASWVVGAGWQDLVAPNGDGHPYFDGISSDGTSMNVANLVLGTGGFTGNSASPHLSLASAQYFGLGSGDYAPGTYFKWGGVQ